MGFAQLVRFRAGTAHPYPAWSWRKRQPFKLMERPPVAMDGSLLSPAYIALSAEDAVERLGMVGGNFVVLWHNDILLSVTVRTLYRQVLRECTQT